MLKTLLTIEYIRRRFCYLLKLLVELFTCGMIVSFDLRSWSPKLCMDTPSIFIDPPADSMMRNSESAIELLPAPVRPTTPI